MGKHAYLIMAHDEFDVLKEILSDLDDERNDIFLHIDKKVQSCPFEMLESCVKKSNFYLVKRMNVNWGGYSQIACELHLIEQATKIKKYDYYHLITGVTYPIKTQDTIHEFFDKNQGIEFVGYDNKKDYGDRVRYIHIFNELGKPDTKLKQIKSGFQNKIVIMQKRINFCKSSVRNIEFKKGLVYWSLTDNAIRFILSQKKIIKKIYSKSFCADEIFVQTILYNSHFHNKIYKLDNEFDGCMRIAKPPRSYKASEKNFAKLPENSYTKNDVSDLISDSHFFAHKFCGESGLQAINLIKAKRT